MHAEIGSGPRAFGGAPLEGNKIVRLVYLDETGIANLDHEPIMVVSAVIINADKQWHAIEAHLRSLTAEVIPEHQREGFVFHAFELFSGVRRFPKEEWSLERRLEILDALVAIPKKFDLTVCFGQTDRRTAPPLQVHTTEKEATRLREIATHANSFLRCCIQVELLMRATAPDEVAMLIAEDRDTVRKALKFAHSVFSGGKSALLEELMREPQFGNALYKLLLPFRRIIDTVHFAQKSESSLLQIADVCAFAIKRHVMKKPHSARLFDPLKDQLIIDAANL